MPLRLDPIDSTRGYRRTRAWPVALFAIEPGAAKLTGQQLLAAQRVGRSADWLVRIGSDKITMRFLLKR